MARVIFQIPIPDNCCAVAREMVSHGLDPDTVLEFMRGDVMCLRGTARAFAGQMVVERDHGTIRHEPWKPLPTAGVDPPIRQNIYGLVG